MSYKLHNSKYYIKIFLKIRKFMNVREKDIEWRKKQF